MKRKYGLGLMDVQEKCVLCQRFPPKEKREMKSKGNSLKVKR